MVMLFVEGGWKGDAGVCREGFRAFFEKLGIGGDKLQVVSCGGRHEALDLYRLEIKNGNSALLLVDSEAPVDDSCQSGDSRSWLPWRHLSDLGSDTLLQPDGSCDLDCHLMVQATESWLITDVDTLKKYFGKGFQASAISKNSNLESVEKKEVIDSLKKASSKCNKTYSKGKHTFKLLMMIDPKKVINAMPWAERLVNHIKEP